MTTLEPRLHGLRAAQLRTAGIDTWVDSAGDTWTWDAFRIRYVRTAAGARRYGVPIGAPIPAGKRVGHKSLPDGSTRVRLTPAQRAVAGKVFGKDSGPNGATHAGGVHLDVDNPSTAGKSLDKHLAGDDLTPGQRRTTKVLRDKVTKIGQPADDAGDGDKPSGDDNTPPPPTPEPPTADTDTPGDPATAPARAAIRSAYDELAASKQSGVEGDAPTVRLSDLRDQLAGSGFTRAQIDAALIDLADDDDVQLRAEEDQQNLTPADRDAAITLGGQDRHNIAISPASDTAPAGTPNPESERAPDPEPAPEPDTEDDEEDYQPLPTVDEAQVEQKAAAIEAALDPTLGDVKEVRDLGPASDFRRALGAAMDEQFPDATQEERNELGRAITRATAEQINPMPGAPQAGRGTRLAVRALERKNAARGKSVPAAMAEARRIIGNPQDFGRTKDGGADYADDGGPGAETMKKLQALRDAGAVISAEVDRRLAEHRANVDTDVAGARDKFQADMNDYRSRSLAFQDEVAEALTEQFPDGDDEFVDELVNELVISPDDRVGTDEQNAFLDQYRDRANGLAAERDQMRDSYSGFIASQTAASRSEADIRREVLNDARPMGGVTMRYRMSEGADGAEEANVRELLGVAESSYPKDWLRKVNAYGGSQGMSVTASRERAAYFPSVNRLDTGKHRDRTMQESTIIHELGHGMESANRQIMAAQWAFLHDRISHGGEPGSREFDDVSQIYADLHPDELGYKDDFKQHYSGKLYDGGGPSQNHEIFTTGMEDLMSNAPIRSMDGDMDQFMLGLLGLL